jgi:hypothetical protein
MHRPGVLAFVAWLLVGFTSAQSTSTTLSAYTSYVPTDTWTIASGTCATGMGAAVAATATAGAQGGVFEDKFGNFWEMECGYYFSGTTYYANVAAGAIGTSGQGIYACFDGCANRINCVGFSYYGTVTGATAGSGKC